MKKQLWILVGGNGAGKTTFYNKMMKPMGMPFLNADNIAAEMYPEDPESGSIDAAKQARIRFRRFIDEGCNFCFETVFSHHSKIELIEEAKKRNYEVILVAIHLDNEALNLARVDQRMKSGGHSVPQEKIISRIPRTIENIKNAIPLCDHVRIVDNSYLNDPFRSIITYEGGELKTEISPIPGWAKVFLP